MYLIAQAKSFHGIVIFTSAGTDYTIQNSVAVTFMPGTARQCITIPINDDSLDELTENFMVNAVSSNSASIAVTDSSAEVCIQDDDCKCRHIIIHT